MEFVIGMDFGNYYSQLGVILGIDPKTRKGGRFFDLADPSGNMPYGIPTAFFYSSRDGEPVCGLQAVKAVPRENCHRYLKRRMKQGSVTIDGRSFKYEDMITSVAKYVIDIANKQLKLHHNVTTNKIALAYPASFSYADMQQLVNLIQKVKLEDGRRVEVVGTIAEPAAAALDYVAGDKSDGEKTVLVYDLGGGTFDVSLLSVYPEGKKTREGHTYYYDVLYTDGIENIGGCEFDAELEKILLKKAGRDASDRRVQNNIKTELEKTKHDLTYDEVVQPQILLADGFTYIDRVTRKEFEAAVSGLVKKTVDMVAEVINCGRYPKPDAIVLTGGGSQMPIIARMLAERLPAFAKKIKSHDPAKAISAGAARFGVIEHDWDVKVGKKPAISPVVLRTTYDVGVCFYDEQKKKDVIDTYIPAGTVIPFTSEEFETFKRKKGRYSTFTIYQAKTSKPDREKPDSDYSVICTMEYDHGKEVPADYPHVSRMVIDERNLLRLEVWEPERPEKKPQVEECSNKVDLK